MMKMRKEPESYETRSLYEAAFLISSGFELQSKHQNEANKSVFLFKNTEKLRSAISEFYAGTAVINAQQFINNFRNVKDIAFSR